MKILLDPGHGKGENRGSLIGNEGDNTFYYALVLKEVLEAYGVTVGLTRNKLEDNPTLDKRGAMAKGYDLLLSLHSNAYSDKNVNGIELWDSVQKPNKDLATKLVNELATHFRANRGVKYKELAKGQDWYGILRANQANHAMLIEHGFHTNLEDVKVFTEKRKELAETTAKVIADYYKLNKPVEKPVEKPKKTIAEVAKDVINGKYGNGVARKTNLEKAGYNYLEVQTEVNRQLGIKPNKPTKPVLKPIKTIAQEVINGLWGNGYDRKNRLTKAGYDYNAVQAQVNELLKQPIAKPKLTAKQVAHEIVYGKNKYGNGNDRKIALEKEGYDYNEVQNEVNKLIYK